MAEPFSCPKCKAPLEAHRVSDGIVVHTCPSCFGVMYRVDDLSVPLKITGAAPARFDCPRCSRPMETGKAYDGQIELDRCLTCAVLWFDAGEIQILRKLSGVENLAGKSADAGSEAPAAPAPRQKKPGVSSGKTSDEPNGVVPPDMARVNNGDEARDPTITFDGRLYRHFQSSDAVTTSVLGEFPWIAKVGDGARVRDFICPPYLLSQEVSSAESVWSAGEYLQPEEVWAAFALPGAPPAKIGVAPAQPNPWADQLPALWGWFALSAAICAGAYVFFSANASRARVYEGSFSVAAADVERSRVGEPFDVKGRTSNLEVMIDTNLEGQWTYVSMALINADTDQALDFGRGLSYYHGVEDGEAWSEGGRFTTFYVPSVPPGRYYLRVEPETDSPLLNVIVVVRRDVPLARLPFIALMLLLLPVVWAAMRSGSFENTRWMESDHPRVSAGGDEDDE